MAEEIREYAVDINTFQDIEVYFDRLTKGENVKIGRIAENITVAIKLDGGRFTNYEAPYVNAVIATMILAHQESYKKIVKQLKKDYNITDLDEEILLQFKLEEGCLEATFEQVNKLLENIKTMSPKMQVFVLSTVVLGLFGIGSYNLISQNMQNNQEIARAKVQNENTIQVIEAVDKVRSNAKLEKAVNESKEKTLKKLNVDENLSYQQSDGRTVLVTKNQIDNYEPKIQEAPPVQEVESTEIITIRVASINYGSEERMVKIVGNSHLFNRDMLTVQDRIKLAGKADNNESINVEVKFIKDQNDKILKAYLLRIVD